MQGYRTLSVDGWFGALGAGAAMLPVAPRRAAMAVVENEKSFMLIEMIV